MCVVGPGDQWWQLAASTVVRSEITVVGSHCYRRADLDWAAGLVAAGQVPDIDIGVVDGLDRADETLTALAAGEITATKAVIRLRL